MSLLQRTGLPRRLAEPIRRRGGLLLALLVCGVMVYTVLAAFGFNEEAGRVPLVVGIPGVLAAIVLVTKELVSPSEPAEDDLPTPAGTPGVPRAGDRAGALGAEAAAEDGPDPPEAATQATPSRSAAPGGNRISTAAASAWILVLGAMFLLLGLLVTVPLFMVVFMRVYGREPWPTVLLVTGISFATIYLFFVRFLSIQAFEGWIRVWLGW